MKKNTYIIVLLFLSLNLSAQRLKIILQGDWEHDIEMQINIHYGLNFYPLVSSKGKMLECNMPDSLDQAILSLGVFKGGVLAFKHEFLYNGTDLSLSIMHRGESVVNAWNKSGLNKQYENFNYYRDSVDQRLQVLIGLYTVIPDTSAVFYDKTRQEIEREKAKFSNYIADIMSTHKNDVLGAYVKNNGLYFPDLQSPQDLMRQMANQYFDNYRPLNKLVLHSPIYKSKLEEYLQLIETLASAGKELTDQEKITEALENYLDRLAGNEYILNQTALALWDKYHHQSMDIVTQYLDENWISTQCHAADNALLQERMKTYERLAVGKLAPAISWSLGDEKTEKSHSLDELKGKETVVIFWASWCPHCEVMLPLVRKLLKQKSEVQVVAIGMDKNKQAWKVASQKYPGWIHVRAEEEWESPEAKAYAIYGTPTFFVLDKEGLIVGKANNFNELRNLIY